MRKGNGPHEAAHEFTVGTLYRVLVLAGLVWTVVVGLLAAWSITDERAHHLELVRNEARANFDKDLAFRYWASRHGGVYVPTDERTPPNPYLSHIPDRDIVTDDGKHLTLMNPAYMLRQMMEEFDSLYRVKGMITSLKPLNPINAPDPWERKALLAFEKGAKEVSEVVEFEGRPTLRLMRPLVTKEPCLKCHKHQGYKVGDIRGGVGVSVPMAPYQTMAGKNIRLTLAGHSVIWLFGIGGLLVAGHQGAARIRAHNRAEEAVRESEARFRAVFDNAADGIFVIDRTGRILDGNRVACESLGYDAEELKKLAVWDVDMSWPAQRMAAIWETLPADRAVTVGEGTHRRKDGTTFPVEIRARMTCLGEREALVAVARDMTQRKAAQESLERSNAELQQFAYVASHDLQEPLRTVTTYVQLLERRLDEKLDEDEREFMGFVVGASKRMRSLIQDLLAYSRVETKAAELVPTESGTALEDALENLRSAVEEADAEIDVGNLPMVMADPGQLRSVFQNLIGNALKYRAPERRPKIEIGAEMAGGMWMFHVCDNGIGIDPKYAHRVFRLFQRLQTWEAKEGTGIGLTITKKIVERHGGRVWLESDLGQGSTFFFTLPPVDSGNSDA